MYQMNLHKTPISHSIHRAHFRYCRRAHPSPIWLRSDVMSDVHQPFLRDRRISNLQHLFHYFINASFTSSYPRHSKSVQLTEDKVSRSPRLRSHRSSCFSKDDGFGVKLVAMIQSAQSSESWRERRREIIYVNDPRITKAYSCQNASASAHTLSPRGLRFATTERVRARVCVVQAVYICKTIPNGAPHRQPKISLDFSPSILSKREKMISRFGKGFTRLH